MKISKKALRKIIREQAARLLETPNPSETPLPSVPQDVLDAGISVASAVVALDFMSKMALASSLADDLDKMLSCAMTAANPSEGDIAKGLECLMLISKHKAKLQETIPGESENIDKIETWIMTIPSQLPAIPIPNPLEEKMKITRNQLRNLLTTTLNESTNRSYKMTYEKPPMPMQSRADPEFAQLIKKSRIKAEDSMKITRSQLMQIMQEELGKSAPFGSGMKQAKLDKDQKKIVGHT